VGKETPHSDVKSRIRIKLSASDPESGEIK
jgi:hypothetical protein